VTPTMSARARLASFTLALAASVGVGAAVGAVVGPIGDDTEEPTSVVGDEHGEPAHQP
jgi:hypothetical protein